jgi:transcription initiation factor IIF auxiliary subunit
MQIALSIVSDDIVIIKHRVSGLSPGSTADQIEQNMEYHLWRVYIEGKVESKQKIQRVQYILDPTFSPQVVEGNPSDDFSYEANGYGSFTLQVRIYVAGRAPNMPITREYPLDISTPEGEGVKVNLNEK